MLKYIFTDGLGGHLDEILQMASVDKGESIHVVCSVTPRSKVVTVYFPDEDQWAGDRIRRR